MKRRAVENYQGEPIHRGAKFDLVRRGGGRAAAQGLTRQSALLRLSGAKGHEHVAANLHMGGRCRRRHGRSQADLRENAQESV